MALFTKPTASSSPASASPVSRATKVNDEEFIQLRDFIYEQSGIYIAETRKYLVENRLTNRLKELNLKNFGEYYYYLRFDPGRRTELPKLFEVITTNETSFYRNPPQLQVFQEKVLTAELDKLRAARTKRLRIWSAGCSTGEEPYTLAMILHEVLKTEIGSWDIKITANDLSEGVLAVARRGIYSEYALRTTPKEIISKYFKKEGETYHVDPKLKSLISFGPINLSDKAMLKRVERSQIVFCRNVIIYFDDDMKRRVIESFYDNLLPGGCLLIGHSESLHSITRAFKPEHHVGTIVYRKEA
jgi:chemotaxis protein methyltransferase CheR